MFLQTVYLIYTKILTKTFKNKKNIFMVEKTNTGFSAFAKDDNINVGTTGATIT